MVRWGEKVFSCLGSRLAEGNATFERKENVERIYEGAIVLTQSEESRRLRVVFHLFWMNRRPYAGGYVYDGTGIN